MSHDIDPLRTIEINPVDDKPGARPTVYTDQWNAEQMLRHHGKDIRHCFQRRSFITFTGNKWTWDESQETRRRAAKTVRSFYAQAAQIEDEKERRKLVSHGVRSEQNRRIKDLIEAFSSLVPISPDEFDSQEVVNFPNCTLDLRTKSFREHRRDDYCTKVTSAPYTKDAECPRWAKFLIEIMDGDLKLISYLQRLAGYSLTPYVNEHSIHIAFGSGANGKGTFFGTLLNVFGDYGKAMDPGMLLVRNGEDDELKNAEFLGVRMALFQETESGKRLNEAFVKAMTGGDRMNGRIRYGHPFQFDPTHTPILATNHRPQIRNNDEGIWRRIHLIPFEVTIPEGKRDKDLPEQLRKEAAGILKWAVDGIFQWLEYGLSAPASVVDATTQYRSDSDILGDFVEEFCQKGRDLNVKFQLLRKAYERWTFTNGYKPLGPQNFSEQLQERGFRRERNAKGRWWEGLTIKPEILNQISGESSTGETGYNEREGLPF